MNNIEDELTDALACQAKTVPVEDNLAAILSGTNPVRLSGMGERHRRRVWPLAAAAASIVVAGTAGLIWLGQTDSETPEASEANQPIESEPAASIAEIPLVTLDVNNSTASADAWSRLPDNQLTGRSEHLVVATDQGLFVWGGSAGGEAITEGAFYDSTDGRWRPVPPAPLAPERGDAIGVWTGTEVVVINGDSGDVKSAAFDPETLTWRELSDPPVGNAANGPSRAVLVDNKVMLFSIFEDGAAPQNQVAILDDLRSGHWSVVDSPPVALTSSVDLVVAGADVAVIGRTSDPTGCGELHVLAFTPGDNSWTEWPAGPTSRLADPVSVWTGSELFVGGGGSCVDGVASPDFYDGAYLLDPATSDWRATATAPEGFYSSYRYPDMWTGNAVGTISPTGRPLLYNPATDDWNLGPTIDTNSPIAPNQTPLVLFENSIVVSGGLPAENSETCCEPFSGTYAYTIPDGF